MVEDVDEGQKEPAPCTGHRFVGRAFTEEKDPYDHPHHRTEDDHSRYENRRVLRAYFPHTVFINFNQLIGSGAFESRTA